MDGIINSMDMSLSKLWEIVKDQEACSLWSHKILDTNQQLNKANKNDEKDIFLVLVLEDLVGLHRTGQLQLL